MKNFDFLGPVIFIPAVVCLLLALQWRGSQYPWKSPIIIALLSAFCVIITIWAFIQLPMGERATIPTRLITQRTVLFSSMYFFFLYAAFVILVFYLPLYFQAVRGATSLGSSIETLPLIVTVTISSIVGGVLVSIVGYCTPFMIIGGAIFAVGVGFLSTLGVNTPWSSWFGYQVLARIGVGLNFQVYTDFGENANQDSYYRRSGCC
jgi:hypothetical protein